MMVEKLGKLISADHVFAQACMQLLQEKGGGEEI